MTDRLEEVGGAAGSPEPTSVSVAGQWFDELLPELVREWGVQVSPADEALIKAAVLDNSVLTQVKNRDGMRALLNFVLDVLLDPPSEPVVEETPPAPARRIGRPARILVEIDDSSVRTLWESVRASAENLWTIFQIRREIAHTDLSARKRTPDTSRDHVRHAKGSLARWLSRNPLPIRWGKALAPQTFVPEPALPVPPAPVVETAPVYIDSPSALQSFRDLVSLQALNALDGKTIRALHKEFPDISVAVIHEITRRTYMRCRQLGVTDIPLRNIAMQVADCRKAGGRYIAHPRIRTGGSKWTFPEGRIGPWEPGHTLGTTSIEPAAAPSVSTAPKPAAPQRKARETSGRGSSGAKPRRDTGYGSFVYSRAESEPLPPQDDR